MSILLAQFSLWLARFWLLLSHNSGWFLFVWTAICGSILTGAILKLTIKSFSLSVTRSALTGSQYYICPCAFKSKIREDEKECSHPLHSTRATLWWSSELQQLTQFPHVGYTCIAFLLSLMFPSPSKSPVFCCLPCP